MKKYLKACLRSLFAAAAAWVIYSITVRAGAAPPGLAADTAVALAKITLAFWMFRPPFLTLVIGFMCWQLLMCII